MFDREQAASRFERRPFQAGGVGGVLYVRKPRVGEFRRYLELVRKCKSEQTAAGPGADFDPAGLTDLSLVRICTEREDGAPAFETLEQVEAALAPGEVFELATMANEMIHPTPNPTTAP
jgi:hypothetical protein